MLFKHSKTEARRQTVPYFLDWKSRNFCPRTECSFAERHRFWCQQSEDDAVYRLVNGGITHQKQQIS